MPYLNITTNVPVNKRQKETIERAISKAILLIPKEKEELLMVNFEDCASLSLSGDFSTPAAMIELRVHNVVIEMNEAELLEKSCLLLQRLSTRCWIFVQIEYTVPCQPFLTGLLQGWRF